MDEEHNRKHNYAAGPSISHHALDVIHAKLRRGGIKTDGELVIWRERGIIAPEAIRGIALAHLQVAGHVPRAVARRGRLVPEGNGRIKAGGQVERDRHDAHVLGDDQPLSGVQDQLRRLAELELVGVVVPVVTPRDASHVYVVGEDKGVVRDVRRVPLLPQRGDGAVVRGGGLAVAQEELRLDDATG